MSKTSDKAKEKLLNTMRKTKAEKTSGASTTPPATSAASKKKPAAPKKAPAKRKASTKSKTASKAKVKRSNIKPDPYQAARRIWPD